MFQKGGLENVPLPMLEKHVAVDDAEGLVRSGLY